MMNETLKLLIGAIVRWLIAGTCVWQVAVNLETNGPAANFIVFGAGSLAVLAWSVVQKLRTVFVIDEALRMPARSTFEDLRQVIE